MSKDLEKQIKEAAFKFLRKHTISKGGYWDEEKQDVVNETVSGKQNVLRSIEMDLPRYVYFATKDNSVKQYWQQGMYSEEDMLNFSFWLLNNIGETSNDRVAHFDNHHYLNKWLEQNKKK